MKLLEILKFSEEYLKKHSFSKPRLESELVIAFVLKLERITLYAYFDMELSSEQKNEIREYLKEMAVKKMTFKELQKNGLKIKVEKDFTDENRELLLKSIEYLKKNGVAEASSDAEYIFSHILNVKRTILSLNLKKEIDANKREQIKNLLIKRAKNREPIQYLLGEWEFYGLPFKVDKRVLIPRADTEILVEQCKTILSDLEKAKVLEIGVGSGAISIALAKYLKSVNFLGVDISEKALEVAVENRKLNSVEENLKFLKSDVFSNVKDTDFDMIISNPPYISQIEYTSLMDEVKLHEPKLALTDDGDGLHFYEKISREAKNYLKDGGYLVFEIGYNQAEEVKNLLEKNSFDIVAIVKDYAGIYRVIIGRKSGEKLVNKNI